MEQVSCIVSASTTGWWFMHKNKKKQSQFGLSLSLSLLTSLDLFSRTTLSLLV